MRPVVELLCPLVVVVANDSVLSTLPRTIVFRITNRLKRVRWRSIGELRIGATTAGKVKVGTSRGWMQTLLPFLPPFLPHGPLLLHSRSTHSRSYTLLHFLLKCGYEVRGSTVSLPRRTE